MMVTDAVRLPKRAASTLRGVSSVSVSVAPVRALSYWDVVTDVAPSSSTAAHAAHAAHADRSALTRA